MENAPLTFILIALGLAAAMLIISWFIRSMAKRQMPGAGGAGGGWIGRANRDDDDFDGDNE